MHECRACGRFRKEGIRPLVGDCVAFDPPSETAAGSIREIEKRRNTLIRPPAANVDLEFIVACPKKPSPDLALIDKLIIQARFQNIEPVLCVNKCDLYGKEADELAAGYEGAVKTICISAAQGTGLDELMDLARGKTACFAGQSAVGKSTLLNALLGESQRTGTLSAKTDRGRHTTRTAQLFPAPIAGTYIMDTPGFSVFDGVRIDPHEIAEYLADFAPYAGKCRFSSCLHRDEPDCAIKEAVEQGRINPGRYERYLHLLAEEEERSW